MTQNKSQISVIIPAYGHCRHLVKIVSILSKQTYPPGEILIVHSGSDDPSYLQKEYPDFVHVQHYDQRKNAATARNLGLNNARYEWVAFIDADVVPDNRWVESLIAAITSHPNSFIVGSVGYEEEGGYWGMSLWMIEFSGIHPYLPKRTVQGGGSGNFIADSGKLKDLGAFSETYSAGEDIHLMAKLRNMGLVNRFYPSAIVKHVNLPGFGHFVHHLAWLGYWSGTYRMSRAWDIKKVAFIFLSPILWIIRLLLIYYRVMRWGVSLRAKSLLLLPGVLLGTIVWNFGFVISMVKRPPGTP